MNTTDTPPPNGAEPTAARLEEIRARIRAAIICPRSSVKGGAHQWTGGSFTHADCAACGHRLARGDRIAEAVDLLIALEMEVAERAEVTADRDRLQRELDARQTETHIVTDDSDDPEHADDCPGCAPDPIELHLTSVQDVVWCDDGDVELHALDATGRPVLVRLTEGQANALREDVPEWQSAYEGPFTPVLIAYAASQGAARAAAEAYFREHTEDVGRLEWNDFGELIHDWDGTGWTDTGIVVRQLDTDGDPADERALGLNDGDDAAAA
jgi:Zn ribbon nucleic-acid-binding protein